MNKESKITTNAEKASEYAKKNKSLLVLNLRTLDATSGYEEINNELLAQTMTLKSIRVHFQTQGKANADANQNMFLKLTSFGAGHLTTNIGIAAIPILHDSSKHDSTWATDIKISLSKKMPKKIGWSLVNFDGTPIATSQLDFVQVVFELELT